jgi:hypothetical protein
VFYVKKYNTVIFDGVTFTSISAGTIVAKGGSLHTQVGAGNKFAVTNSQFAECEALNGYGGAVYSFFTEQTGHTAVYLFSDITFKNNLTINGTNIFVEGYDLSSLIVAEWFKLTLGSDLMTKFNEIYGLEWYSDEEGGWVSQNSTLVTYMMGDQYKGMNLIYVLMGGNEMGCEEHVGESPFYEACNSLASAVQKQEVEEDNIQIVDFIKLNDVLNVVKVVVIIKSAIPTEVVVLLIGENGGVYMVPVVLTQVGRRNVDSGG